MVSNPVIHLIDDDEGVRKSLAFSLTVAGHAVRVHDSAVSFLAALPGLQPGCIVSDIRMPEIDGVELQRRLNQMGNRMPVIIMTGHGDVRLAVEAMREGAVDFLEKPFDDDILLAAIRVALERFARTESDATEAAQLRFRLASLSEREKQVLDSVVAGKANKVIARELKISPRTVEAHRAGLMAKMGADNVAALVRMTLAAGRPPDG